jgi:hypothetical protein
MYRNRPLTSFEGDQLARKELKDRRTTGPSVILLQVGVTASQHMMKLGRALADAFTVYLPDRRGRGMNGAFGSAYSVWREDEDLAAMVEHTMADCVRGDAPAGRTDSLR